MGTAGEMVTHKARALVLKSQVLLPLLTHLQHSEDYNTLWVGGGMGNINFVLTVSGGKHTDITEIDQLIITLSICRYKTRAQ